jgi:glycosyltransferase involved in cell wall biosynthesis
MQKNNEVVTLSKYVAEKLHNLDAKQIELRYQHALPSKTIKGEYFLFIGRMKTYKNLPLVLRVFHQRSDSLIIAGNQAPSSSADNIVSIKEWTSDEEFEGLIRCAKAVICVPFEASQSGVIAEALRLGTPIICSDVGGLREQVRDGIDGIILKSIDDQGLSDAIESITLSHWNMVGSGQHGENLAGYIRRNILLEAK